MTYEVTNTTNGQSKTFYSEEAANECKQQWSKQIGAAYIILETKLV